MEKIKIQEEISEVITIEEIPQEDILVDEIFQEEIEIKETEPEAITIEEFPETKEIIVEKIVKEKGVPGKTPTKKEIVSILKEVFPEDKLIEKILKKIPKKKELSEKELVTKILAKIPKEGSDDLELGEDRGGKFIKKGDKKYYLSSGMGGAVMSSGVHDFILLRDAPNTYEGQAGRVVKVKADETGLEYGIDSDAQDLQSVTDRGNVTTNSIEADSFVTTGGTSADYVKGDGSLGTVDLSGYVPYTGATSDVDLGSNTIYGRHGVYTYLTNAASIFENNGVDYGIVNLSNYYDGFFETFGDLRLRSIYLVDGITGLDIPLFSNDGVIENLSGSFSAGSFSATNRMYSQNTLEIAGKSYLNGVVSYLPISGTSLYIGSGAGGAEKLTNGTFTGSASSWTLGTGWAYSSNTVVKNANGTGTLSQAVGSMVTQFVIGEVYSLVFTLSSFTAGTIAVSAGGATIDTLKYNTYNGGGSQFYTFLATSNTALTFTPSNDARCTIDSVYLKKHTSGDLGVAGTSYLSALKASGTASFTGAFSVVNASPTITLESSAANAANAGTLVMRTPGGAESFTHLFNASANIYTMSYGANVVFSSTGAINTLNIPSSATGGVQVLQLTGNTWTNSTLVQKLLNASVTVNQSGTAGFDFIDVSWTQTAIGSGEKNLIRFSKSGTDMFKVDYLGNTTFADGANLIFNTTTGSKIGNATTQKLAFHNSTPVVQRAGAAQAAVATTGATNVVPYGFTTAAQADALVTLVNELRAALVEKGLIKGSA